MSAWRDFNRPDVQVWRFEEIRRLETVRETRWQNALESYVQWKQLEHSGDVFSDAARGLFADRIADWMEAVFAHQRYCDEGDHA